MAKKKTELKSEPEKKVCRYTFKNSVKYKGNYFQSGQTYELSEELYNILKSFVFINTGKECKKCKTC